MKTIYRPDTAAEFFDALHKVRGAQDTSPVISGRLRIEHGQLKFDGNADLSKLTTRDVLAEMANRLGLEAMEIVYAPVQRGGERLQPPAPHRIPEGPGL